MNIPFRILLSAPLIAGLIIPLTAAPSAMRSSRAATPVNIAAGDIEGLRAAINAANKANQPAEINLAANATYTFTAHDTSPLFSGTGPQPRTDYEDGPDALPLLSAGFTIHGNGATFKRTGTDKFRFFQLFPTGSLILDHLTLQDGINTEGGGAILAGAPLSVTIDHVTFVNNQAYEGGALSSLDGMTITNSTFTGNSATDNGGAISFGTSISLFPLTIKDSTFTDNHTPDGFLTGGAIMVAGGTANISGSDFERNIAGDGGAVFVDTDGAVLQVDHSRFIANRATDVITSGPHGGGAIGNNGHKLNVTDSTFTNNESLYEGGGIFNQANTLSVTGSAFANNQSAVGGGAIYEHNNTDDPAGTLAVTQSCLLNDRLKATRTVRDELFVYDTTGFTATNNWWGTASGPPKGILDADSSPIVMTPFLTAAPAICSGDVPTPEVLAALPTATSIPPCTSTADYTVTIPKGDIPNGGSATCEGSAADGLTIYLYTATGELVTQFTTPITVCLRGAGTLKALSITSGDGKFHNLKSTSANGFTCATLTSPGLIQFG